MNIINKIKDDYNQLTPKRQEAAKEILWTAFEMIPIVGKTGKIIRLSRDFFDKSDPQIELLIHKISIEADKYNLSDTQLEYFKTAVINTFKEDSFRLSKYFYNRSELVDLLLENYNTVKIEADTSENTRNFIASFAENLFPVLHKLNTSEEMLSSFMNGSNEQHKILMEYLQSEFETIKSYIVNDENKYKYTKEITDDNAEFEAKYNNPRRAQLFLDKTDISENQILLQDVYVDPCIAGETSLLGFLDNWKKFYDEKGNETPSILLLSGKAGVGKTSLVSKLIADKYFDAAAHAIFLKDYTAEFNSTSNPWKQIKKVFGCQKDEEYDKQVLILDGFDELCVLKGSEFNGKNFLLNLAEYIPVKINVKVLITSREHDGYYDKIPSNEPNIIERTICWTEHEMTKWCDKYSEKRNDKKINDWCENFQNSYIQLDEKRKEIFCTPIILYICCHEDIDISQNKKIVDIYDKAFKNIVSREYSTGIPVEYPDILTQQEKAIVLWQLTKEIAYQMFLHNTLTQGANNDLINNAKSRVKELKKDILKKLSDYEIDKILDKMLDELPAIFHFASRDDKNGMEFAHKTVCEYFSAVKIYEDYFAKYNKEYFDSKCKDNIPTDVVNSVSDDIINAFRYEFIHFNMFDYLSSMKSSVYNGINENGNKNNGLYFEGFSKVYEEIMRTHKWCESNCMPPTINEYKTEDLFISAQLCLTFGNLVYFLTEHGFTNDNNIAECKNIVHLLSSKYSCVNLSNWNLNNADLSYAYFDHANLNDAHLENAYLAFAFLFRANLNRTHLNGTHLEGANLEDAYLYDANLEGAYLEDANMVHAHLEGANLMGANLRGTNFKGAHMEAVYLEDASLEFANLSYAHLNYAYLEFANLKRANLKDAHLEEVHLEGANLMGADMTHAHLEGAKYLKYGPFKTIFPTGFNPDEAGMIAVDENNDNNRSEEEN